MSKKMSKKTPKILIAALLAAVITAGALVGVFIVPAFAKEDNVYWQVTDNVLHLSNASYAGDNSDRVTIPNIPRYETPWSSQAADITSVIVDNDIYSLNTNYWFSGLVNCTSMDLAKLHTNNVTSMKRMFANCSSLTSLDLSGFDTINVTDMSSMFDHCSSLTSLNLSSFNTTKVTNMSSMFDHCSSLTSLNLSSFNTANVTNMSSMFEYCRNLPQIDVSLFNTSKVTGMSNMFKDCAALTSLNINNFNTSKGFDMSYMFAGCESLTSLDLNSFNTSNVNYMSYMFQNCKSLTSLNISNFNTSNVTDMSHMFESCKALKTLDISSFNTTNVTDMGSMFSNCPFLQLIKAPAVMGSATTNLPFVMYDTAGNEYTTMSANITLDSTLHDVYWKVEDGVLHLGRTSYAGDRSDFVDTRNIEHDFYNQPWSNKAKNITSVVVEDDIYPFNTSRWFYDFENCTSMDLTKLHTNSVTDMWGMFEGCKALTSVDASGFNTTNVKYMNNMFADCSSLQTLDLSSFNTSSVTTMGHMFTECTALTELNLSSFDTSNVTSMSGMFFNCKSLTSLNLSDFDTTKVINMARMFYGCDSLKSLNVHNFNTTNVEDAADISLNSCDSLEFLVCQSTGSSAIVLPCSMKEKDIPNIVLYSKMPSGSKTLVLYNLSFLEEATDTMLYFRKTVNGESIALDIYNFGVYKENGTLVTTVQNDSNGNILVETKDLPIGKYYLQEIKDSNSNIRYDETKQFFNIKENTSYSTTTLSESENNYVSPIDSTIFTNPENRLEVSAFVTTVYDKNGNVLYTGHSYNANGEKQLAFGTLGQVYVNPTLNEINAVRGEVYTGSQTDLADAIRCILYFNKDNAQTMIWGLLNGSQTVDTSNKNSIPDWFSWAIIESPDSSMYPVIIPLAISKDVVTDKNVNTGMLKTRSFAKEANLDFDNIKVSASTLLIKKNINVIAGAYVPAATYNFNITGITAEEGATLQGGAINLYTGITEGLTQPTISIENNILSKYCFVDFSAVSFPKAGAYQYKVKEAAGSVMGMIYDTAEYLVNVYVGYPEEATIHTPDKLEVLQIVAYNSANEKSDVIFNNGLETYSLSIEKQVSGSQGDYNKDFDFSVSFNSLPAGTTINYTKYLANGSTEQGNFTVSENAQHFSLKHGEKVVIANLPSGVEYTVTENVSALTGYTTTITDGDNEPVTTNTLTKTLTENNSLLFINDRSFTPDTGVVLATIPFVILLAIGGIYLLINKRRKTEQ